MAEERPWNRTTGAKASEADDVRCGAIEVDVTPATDSSPFGDPNEETRATTGPAGGEASQEQAGALARTKDGPGTNKAAGRAVGVAKGAANTLKAGAYAVRDVHNASRQSADARAQVRTIQKSIEADKRTLGHRREIEASYEEIVSEQSGIVAARKAEIDADRRTIAGLVEEHAALESDLDELKAANASAIRPYKRLVETSKDELDDCQRMLAEAKRAVKAAESQLQEAKERRESSYASASRSFDGSQARQRKVLEELEQLKETGGSQAAIAQLQEDSVAALANVESARAAVERATRDGQGAVDNAQTHLWTQNQSLASAQEKYDAALAKHKAHKAEHDKMADDATEQEGGLQERIDAKKRELDALRAKAEAAQREQDEAQGLLDEAELIHSTPEETQRLAESIAAQEAELAEASSEAEQLAENEKQLRHATRGSRVALIAVAVATLLVVAFIVVSCAAQ